MYPLRTTLAAVFILTSLECTPKETVNERPDSTDQHSSVIREDTSTSLTSPSVNIADILPGGRWTVAHSPTISLGQTYEFRTDNTMVITSPGSKPAIGKWQTDHGKLSITEESITYSVDVLSYERDSLTLLIRNPGRPTLIDMVRR